MYIPKHPNYIKSSNLTFGTAVIGLISLLLSPEILSNGKYIAISIISLLFVVGIGFLIRQGIDWVKYLLLVFMIIGLISLPAMINAIIHKPVSGLISLAQTIMQIWAIVLLFKIPTPLRNNRTWHPTKNS